MKRILFVIVIFWFANTGCGSIGFTVQVESFHNLNAADDQKIYAFVPTPEQKKSLEYKTYQGIVRTSLNKYGFIETPKDEALYLIEFYYSISGPQKNVGSTPIYGQTGVISSRTTGTVSRSGYFSGKTTHTPTYGVVGSQSYSYSTFTRTLGLNIFEKGSEAQHVYEGRAISTGSSGSLSRIIPVLVEALFQDFPGESGKARKVTIREKIKPTNQEKE